MYACGTTSAINFNVMSNIYVLNVFIYIISHLQGNSLCFSMVLFFWTVDLSCTIMNSGKVCTQATYDKFSPTTKNSAGKTLNYGISFLCVHVHNSIRLAISQQQISLYTTGSMCCFLLIVLLYVVEI